MTIALCCNDSKSAYNFRLGFIKKLQELGHKVYIICEEDEFSELLRSEGLNLINLKINKARISLFDDCKLYRQFKKIFKAIKPDMIINYTIKIHLFATLAARRQQTKIVNFFSGIGSCFLENNLMRFVAIRLYRYIAKHTDKFIFLNRSDIKDLKKYKIIKNDNYHLINGEGVDLQKFRPRLNLNQNHLNFCFIGRLIKEKGICEFLQAAEVIKTKHENVNFYICGQPYDKKSVINLNELEDYEYKGIVNYLGFCLNINEVLDEMDAIVLPSYREGMSMALIEGFAKAIPGIASNVPGCCEIIDDGINGFLFQPKNVASLVDALEAYINLPFEERVYMANAAYSKAVNCFDEEIIIRELLKILEITND